MQASTTQVMFYLLKDDDSSEQSLVHQACLQAAYFYRQNKKVFMYSQDQAAAHQLDELLWSFEPDSFVPHNLAGEGPSYGAAVEISWQAPTGRRPVLINLTSTVPPFANQFSYIIDFVPTDESLKQQARDRFRACRQLGFTVGNQPVPQAQVSTDVITS